MVTAAKKLKDTCSLEEKLWPDSVHVSFSVMSDSLQLCGLHLPGLPVHHQLPEFTHSCALSRWCYPTISSSVVPFSSCLQSCPTSGSSQMSQFFASGGQSSGVSASASVLPMNIQEWFPLGWSGWISLQSKRLSRVFSNITVQKHQFFGAQLSLWSTGKTIALISSSNYFYLWYILYVTSSTF